MEQGVAYTFGAFRLDTKTQLLHQNGESIRLQPRIYALLLYFLNNPDRVVSRQELFEALWPGVIVEDSALRLAINSLRNTLQDRKKPPRYIQTIFKQGFRFLAKVGVDRMDLPSNALNLDHLSQFKASCDCLFLSSEKETFVSELVDAYQETRAGARKMVFLAGESGTGKTHLLERFLIGIDHTEFSLLRARCVHMGGACEPFMPLLEALERRCREHNGKALVDNLHRLAPTWLYQILNVLEEHEVSSLFPKISQVSSGRMLREGADFFEYQGSDHPFVLILDNAQWCDDFTLDLLNFLLFRRSPTHLMLIVSYRSEEYCRGTRRLEIMRNELALRGLDCQLKLTKPSAQRPPIEPAIMTNFLE